MPIIKQFGQGSMLRDAAILRSMLSGTALPIGAINIADYVDTDYGLTVSSNKVRVYAGTGLKFSIVTPGALILDWAGSPGTILPDEPGSAGVSAYAAHTDHAHPIACGAAGSILPDASAAEGTALSFARSDHAHAIVCAAPGADSVGTAASAEGTATSFARSDHAHNIQEADSYTWTGLHTFSYAGGIVINQGAGDGEIIALRSSDVAHGLTSVTTTDTYGFLSKASANSGGLMMRGATEATIGLAMFGYGSTDDTTKSAAGLGYVVIDCGKISGTALATPGADAGVLAVRSNNSTLMILDAEGDLWWSGNLQHSGGSVGFYGVTPVARQAQSKATQTSGTCTADATYSANERDAINALVTDMTNAFTWLTDLTTKLENTGIIE